MNKQVILIQGAMDIEIGYLISKLNNVNKKEIAGYEFFEGNIKEKKIIISKTGMGTINATIATTIAINTFKPQIIINQGIAGAHKKELHIGDIVIGKKCCNINSYSMNPKEEGKGCSPFEWMIKQEIYETEEKVLEKIRTNMKNIYGKNVYVGTLGSGDVFNREVDRINWISNKLKTYSEDMESIGVYATCNRFKVPCVGIRIISNNEITLERINENMAIELQKNIEKLIEKM